MNRNGPPSCADCHMFDDDTICLKLGWMRYSRQLGHAEVLGERPLAREVRRRRDVHHHRRLRPEQLLRGLEHGHPRRGECEPLVGGQVRVVGDDARDVGLRRRPRERETQVAPSLLGEDVDGLHVAERLIAAVGPVHAPLQFQRLPVVERAVLFVVPDGARGGDRHQRAIGRPWRQLVPRRSDLGRNGVLVVAAHHRSAFGVEAERQERVRSVDTDGAVAAAGARRVADADVRLVRGAVGVDQAGVGGDGFRGLEGVADAGRGEADRVLAAERPVLAEALARNRLQHTGIGVGLDEHVVGHRAAGRGQAPTSARRRSPWRWCRRDSAARRPWPSSRPRARP